MTPHPRGMLRSPRLSGLIAAALVTFASPAAGQSTGPGESRIAEWTATVGGGAAQELYNSAAGRQLITASLGRGWFLRRAAGEDDHSAPHGLEWLVEATPAVVIFQSSPVYGVGLTPVLLRWTSSRPKVAPFLEWAGGLAFMSRRVPERTSRFNFTSSVGVGVRLRSTVSRDVLMGYRLHHLSNGETAHDNPGVNTHLFFVAVAWRPTSAAASRR